MFKKISLINSGVMVSPSGAAVPLVQKQEGNCLVTSPRVYIRQGRNSGHTWEQVRTRSQQSFFPVWMKHVGLFG